MSVSTKEKIKLLTEEFTDLTRFSPYKIKNYLRDIMVVIKELFDEIDCLKEEKDPLGPFKRECLTEPLKRVCMSCGSESITWSTVDNRPTCMACGNNKVTIKTGENSK